MNQTPKHPSRLSCVLTLALSICALAFPWTSFAQDATNAPGATVTTDASDYPPGSTVYITGTGFAGGETVQCQVLTLTQPNDDLTSPAHQPWTVTADDAGNISTIWLVPL